MPQRQSLPTLTRVEGKLSEFRPANYVVTKIHNLRKRLHMRRIRVSDARCPTDLRNFESKVFSQYGEDGILEEIFRRIGERTKFAVEFGIEDGSECNTRRLIEVGGWSAVLFDGSPSNVTKANTLYAGRTAKAFERFLHRDNILSAFSEAGIPADFDLLSIDIDGNDYWLWETILQGYRPRVVVIEYNGRWAPPTEWIMPYDPKHRWDGTVYFGASLQSLTNLGQKSGYKLVACSAAGLNAFFVKDDQVGEHFATANRGASYHYAAPIYTHGFGHPVRKSKLASPTTV